MTISERPVRPVRPDQREFDNTLKTINEEISSLKAQLDEVIALLPSKSKDDSSQDPQVMQRNGLRSQMQSHRDAVKLLTERRTVLFADLTALQQQQRKRQEQQRQERDKMRFKSVAEIDAQVALLEQQLHQGALTLMEEKKAVSELSSLSKARKTLEAFSGQQASPEADRSRIETIRAEIKAVEEQRNTINKQYDAVKAEFEVLNGTISKAKGDVGQLLDRKKATKALLDAAYDKLRETRKTHSEQLDAFNKYEREERAKRQAEYKLKQKEENDLKQIARAERELEEANVPAFADEINLCDTLLSFCNSLLNPSHKHSAATAATTTAKDNVRRVVDAPPPRVTVLAKKTDRQNEDDFLVLGNKKNKNKKKQSEAPAASKPIKLDLEMISQFAKLNLPIPASTDELASTIELIESKKTQFVETQTAKTASNKKAALARLAKLRASLNGEETVEATEEAEPVTVEDE